MRRITSALLLALSLAGCAATNLPPVTSPEFTFAEDEKRLWLRSEEEEKAIDASGMVSTDRELQAYVNEVAKKLQPAAVFAKIPFQVRVLMNPYSNAFAFPNGVIYVHSGILAKMDNEAQLATLLAHEMTHATHRHQVREFRGTRNKAAVFASVQSTLGTLPGIGGLAMTLGEIGTMAAVTGYSRDLETEADMEGIRRVVQAGYDPAEAPRLFQHIKEEMDEEEVSEPFFFGSHPRLKARIENYEKFLREQPAGGGETGSGVFQKKVSGVVLENALLELQAGRFGKAREGADKFLASRPKDPRGYCLLGEICRQRGEKEDLEKARGYLRKAISLDPSYPDSYRTIGIVLLKSGKKPEARKAFETYLKKAPKAADRSYIEQYVAQCR